MDYRSGLRRGNRVESGRERRLAGSSDEDAVEDVESQQSVRHQCRFSFVRDLEYQVVEAWIAFEEMEDIRGFDAAM